MLATNGKLALIRTTDIASFDALIRFRSAIDLQPRIFERTHVLDDTHLQPTFDTSHWKKAIDRPVR